MIPLPTYSVQEIEREASNLLTARFGRDVPIPVDVELLLEQTEGVTLDVYPALRANHGTDGMVLRDVKSGDLFVHIDEDLADSRRNRYRMTVAEELGHICLHRSVIDRVCSIEDFREIQRHANWYEAERNAKQFAAAILMPGPNLVSEAEHIYPKLVEVAGYDNAEAIKRQLCSLLAKRFEVSIQTMSYRLTEWPVEVSQRVDAAVRDRLGYLGG